MIALAIFAFLVGAVLGMRWRVLVLLPTCAAFAIIAIAGSMITSGSGLAATAQYVLMVLLAHQAGYLFGAVVHAYLAYGARQRATLIVRAQV